MPSFRERRFAPLPSCRLWSRSAAGLPTALSRCLGLNRKACHPSALTQAFGRVPAFRRAESGGTKLRDSALSGFYHDIIIPPFFVALCSPFSTDLCTACAYMFYCPQRPCVHFSANVHFVVIHSLGGLSPRPPIDIALDQQRPQRSILHLSRGANNLGLNQCKPFLFFLYLLGQGKIRIRLVCGHVTAAARRVLDRRRCACRPRPRPYSCLLQSGNALFQINAAPEPILSSRWPLPPRFGCV